MTLGISQIAHWALKVHDLERSLAFYRDTLGFQEMMRLARTDGPVEQSVSVLSICGSQTCNMSSCSRMGWVQACSGRERQLA